VRGLRWTGPTSSARIEKTTTKRHIIIKKSLWNYSGRYADENVMSPTKSLLCEQIYRIKHKAGCGVEGSKGVNAVREEQKYIYSIILSLHLPLAEYTRHYYSLYRILFHFSLTVLFLFRKRLTLSQHPRDLGNIYWVRLPSLPNSLTRLLRNSP
jgi:hypothetical protein